MNVAATAPMMLPALREDLRLFEAAPAHDGALRWTIQDPVRNSFVSIGWLEFELLLRWHLGAPQQVLAQTNADTPLDVSNEELDAFTQFLSQNQLLDERSEQRTEQLVQMHRKSQQSWFNMVLHHYLFFRVPLWHPDRWLAAMMPWVQWIYSRQTRQALLLMGLMAAFMTLQQWDVFKASFVDTLSPSGLLGYLLALAVTKSLHELGHAFTATRHGVRVPHMGVAFLVLWPVLYTDTSESWRVQHASQRLAISSAGVASELALAVVALLAWNWTPPGALREGLFFLATTAWVISLAINASPFLRFDGYYILSDLTDTPNLHERAGAMARAWLRRALLGWEEPAPEQVSPQRARLMVAFALTTWLYRFVLFLGIAVAVYLLFFKLLGIFLFAVEIWWFVAKPIWRETSVWIQRRGEIKTKHRAAMALTLVLLLAAGLIPWRAQLSVPAWSHSAQSSIIYSPSAAQVAWMVPQDTAVQAGDVVFKLTHPSYTADARRAQETQLALQEQLQGLNGVPGGENQRAYLRRQWQEAQAREQAASDAQARLQLRAPAAGVVTDVDPQLRPGVWVNPKQALAVVYDPSQWVVETYVSQRERDQLRVGNAVSYYTKLDPLTALPGRITQIDQERTARLPNAMMSSQYGGDIAIESHGDQGLVPKDSLYRVHVALDAGVDMRQVTTGHAVLETEPVALLSNFLKQVAVVLIREANF